MLIRLNLWQASGIATDTCTRPGGPWYLRAEWRPDRVGYGGVLDLQPIGRTGSRTSCTIELAIWL
jgi:hypothetical protein